MLSDHKRLKMLHVARGWSSPASTAARAGLLDGNVRLKVMHLNFDGLIVVDNELEFMDCISESAPDIVGVMETKLTEEVL